MFNKTEEVAIFYLFPEDCLHDQHRHDADHDWADDLRPVFDRETGAEVVPENITECARDRDGVEDVAGEDVGEQCRVVRHDQGKFCVSGCGADIVPEEKREQEHRDRAAARAVEAVVEPEDHADQECADHIR